MEVGQTIYIQGFGSENMRAIIVSISLYGYTLRSKCVRGLFTLNRKLCYAEPEQHCSNPNCKGLLKHLIIK